MLRAIRSRTAFKEKLKSWWSKIKRLVPRISAELDPMTGNPSFGVTLGLLNDPSRSLYRSCQIIEFPAFGPEFTDWVVGRFATVGISCEQQAIRHLRELVQDTPNYVQMVCFHLVAQGRSHIGFQDMEEGLETVVRQNAYAYQTLLNSLTLAQQRVLRLAAHERRSLFQKELLVKYEIASASALHSSIKALKKKGILDEEGTRKGNVLFDDPLFAYWLRLCFAA